MRVLVCGGRDFSDRRLMYEVLDAEHSVHGFTLLIHGGARGADTMAGDWARKNNIPVQVFHAEWGVHGRAAGPIRNERMLAEGKPDFVIGFPSPQSVGTRHMLRIAQAAGVEILEVNP